MEFKPTKDQRKVVNKFSKYIIGADYKYKAARLCPKTREYVIPFSEYSITIKNMINGGSSTNFT